MTTSAGGVEVTLTFRDRFTPGLQQAQNALKAAGAQMDAVGQRMMATGASMTRALTLPITAIGGGAVAAFSSFDNQMKESLAIMGDVSDEMQGRMARVARSTALEVEASASDMARGYFFLASAGLDAAAAVEALPTVARFAQAGAFDLALATDLLTDAQSALGLTIRDDVVKNMENMTRVSDVLVKANTLANATVEQFSTALTREAGAALKSFGKDVEEGVAVLAAFADQGVKGEIAGTGLSRVMRLMTASAVQNSEAYKKFGVEVFDSTGKMNNFADIIEDLEDAFEGMSDKQRTAALDALGFKARVQGVILPLLGTSDAIRNFESNLRKAGGTTREVSEKQLESFAKQMKILRDQIVDVAIELGSALVPILRTFIDVAVRPAIEMLRSLVEWFNGLSDGVKTAVVVLAGLAAAAGPVILVIGGLVSAFGGAIAALGALSGTGGMIALVVAGLAALVPAVVLLWRSTEDARRVLANMATLIRVEVVAALQAFRDSVPGQILIETIRSIAMSFVNLAQVIGKAVAAVWDFIGGMEGMIGVLRIVAPPLGFVLDKIAEFVDRASRVRRAQLAETFDATAVSSNLLADEMDKASESFAGLDQATAEMMARLNAATDDMDDFGDAAEEMAATVEDLREGFQAQIDQSAALISAYARSEEEGKRLEERLAILNELLDRGVDAETAFATGLFDIAQRAKTTKANLDELRNSVVPLVIDLTRLNDSIFATGGGFRDILPPLSQTDRELRDLLGIVDIGIIDLTNMKDSWFGNTDALREAVIAANEAERQLERTNEQVRATSDLSRDLARALADAVFNTESLSDALETLFTGRAKNSMVAFFETMLGSLEKAQADFVALFKKSRDEGVGLADSLRAAWQSVGKDIGKAFKEAFAGLGTLDAALGFGFNAATTGRTVDLFAGLVSGFAALITQNYLAAFAAFAGVLIGIFRDNNGDLVDALARGLADSNLKLSQELADHLRNVAVRDFGGDVGAAFFANLAQVIEENVLKTTTQLNDVIDSIALIMEKFTEGTFDAETAVTSLNDSLIAMLKQFKQAGGGVVELQRIMQVFLDTLAMVGRTSFQDPRTGLEVINPGLTAEEIAGLADALAEFVKIAADFGDAGLDVIRQIADAAREAGVETELLGKALQNARLEFLDILEKRGQFLLDQARDMVDGLRLMMESAGSLSRQEIEFAAISIVQAFAAMQESGMSLVDIVRELSGLFNDIRDAGFQLALDLPDAFNRLGDLFDILANEKLQGLLDRLKGIAAAAQAAGNMGILTFEQFDALGDSIRRAYRRLRREGLSHEEALAALAPQLQLLNDLAEMYGFRIDRNTLKLLEMAKNQGVVTEKGLTQEDILIRGFDKMLEALNAIIVALGGVPIEFENWAKAGEDAAERTFTAFKTVTDSALDAAENVGDAWELAAIDLERSLQKAGDRGNEVFNQLGDAALAAAEIASGAWFDGPFEIVVKGDVPGLTRPPRFAGGSGGLLDFGAGTPAILHGSEEVLTGAQGRGVADMVRRELSASSSNSALSQSIDELARSLWRQQREIEIERRDEWIKGRA